VDVFQDLIQDRFAAHVIPVKAGRSAIRNPVGRRTQHLPWILGSLVCSAPE
jgi:hypothetical protein